MSLRLMRCPRLSFGDPGREPNVHSFVRSFVHSAPSRLLLAAHVRDGRRRGGGGELFAQRSVVREGGSSLVIGGDAAERVRRRCDDLSGAGTTLRASVFPGADEPRYMYVYLYQLPATKQGQSQSSVSSTK